MEKRLFNKLGFETSLLGLGCMRFPQKNGKIDLLETEKLVDACMAGGINYFDTAYVYGDGDSENAVKRTLVERYPRERFYLANKLPMWLIPEGHTPQELLETSLKRTGVTYFDQYLLHNLNQENWEICKKENLVDFIFAKKAAGAVRNAGFSFHDTPEVLHEILDAADWDFVQLQINYYDWETAQRAKEQYEMVEARGIPCIIMEPVRGGSLASPHPDVVSLLTAAAPKASPASWALRFAGSLPNTAVVLSGMSDMAQVTENLRLFGQFQPLSIAETELLQQAVSILESLPLIPCTGCNYCKGCPKGVRISSAFEAYNSCLRFDQMADLRARIQSCGIADCIECGKCEGHCPQHIAIPKELKRVLACAEAEVIRINPIFHSIVSLRLTPIWAKPQINVQGSCCKMQGILQQLPCHIIQRN